MQTHSIQVNMYLNFVFIFAGGSVIKFAYLSKEDWQDVSTFCVIDKRSMSDT